MNPPIATPETPTEPAAGGRSRLNLGVAALLSLLGVLAWFTMPREEDPKMRERFALVVATYPGADAEKIERLVVEPLEEELAEVEDLKRVRATIRSGVAVLNLDLTDDVDDIDRTWDEVDDAIEAASRDFPTEVPRPRLDHQINDTESMVIGLTMPGTHGPDRALALADLAEQLERELLRDRGVARVVTTGDPGEQISVIWRDEEIRRLDLDPRRLADLLTARNTTIPGGAIALDGRRVILAPDAEFERVDELAEAPIVLPSGASVPLGELARIERTPAYPASERAWMDGERALFVGIIPRDGINAVTWGADIRVRIAAFESAHPELAIRELSAQPDKVEARLGDLGRSLLVGIAIVAAVLVFTMGPRLGLIVASIVPLVTFAAVAIYAAGGGVLHQIAVAALVLALGLLVDNAIVMAESVQRKLDEGQSPQEARRGAVRELAFPLASATGTTLAAFVPMLISEGGSADFTRAIPLVVSITLLASYGYALVVTPALASWGLRARPSSGPGWADHFGAWIGGFAVRRPGLVILLTLAVFGIEGWSAGQVKKSFFPASDREQLVVTIELPEGTHLEATDELARAYVRELSRDPEVLSTSTFVGRSTPAFYYNLPRVPNASHLAQVVVTTPGPDAVIRVQQHARQLGAIKFPPATVIATRLEQGPPVPAPVEIRLKGTNLADLDHAANQVLALMRQAEGTLDVRTNAGLGAPSLHLDIDDAAAGRHGLQRADVAISILERTWGLDAGTFRGGDDPVPIRIRSPRGEAIAADEVEDIQVAAPGGPPVPLLEVARLELEYAPAVIHRRDRIRTTSVLAQVDADHTYEDVLGELGPQLDALELPSGVEWEIGGAAETSKEANASLGAKMPYGLLLLVVVLLAEFNSFRRVAIILTTAPLAAMGIWPGLLLAGLPFGFVALLGAIALIGIVVNAAIVLVDVADRRLEEGLDAADAMREAVELRTRPILLTTLTTIAGLLPLGVSSSTLWPPMAWAMISGLTVATLLSLALVPALYRLAFAPWRGRAHA